MQFYISIVIVPVTTVIVVMLGVLLNNVNMNHWIADLRSEFTARFDHQNHEFRSRFDQLQQSLLRVEGLLDARLTQIERHLNLR